jgi:hypothetical protein
VSDPTEILDDLCDNWPDTPLGWWSYTDRYAVAEMVVAHLRSLPVDQRMEMMGMKLASHRFVRREGAELDTDAWWYCAVCGAYETNSLHQDRWVEAAEAVS